MSHHRHTHSSSSSSSSSSVLDALFCEEEEEQWDVLEEEDQVVNHQSSSLLPLLLLEKNLFLEDEDLISLFSKEQQIKDLNVLGSVSFSLARREAVEWMLKVNTCYGFSTLTATLSVNYFDRFLHKSPHLHQQDKPWMIQLAAVTCLSLAAKFEEPDAPLPIDLQVEGTKYMFEPMTIQKMELLILSTLDWKMNPVTPISFLDHIIRQLGLKNHLQFEFHRRCEQLLLSIVADSRFVAYLPSVVATATMMHVIDHIPLLNPLDYHNHLLALLDITKENVKECYDKIVAVSENSNQWNPRSTGNKREREASHEPPSSPKGVLEAYYISSDSSNDSWALTSGGSSTSSSVSSSPDKRVAKKKRVEEEQSKAIMTVGELSVMGYVVAISVVRHLMMEELLAFFLIFGCYIWRSY